MLPEGEAKDLRSVFQMFGGFVPRLAALYVALFILPGIQMPFFPVWLKAKDVDASLIGVVLAVPMVARVLAIPVVAREADRLVGHEMSLQLIAADSSRPAGPIAGD